MKSTLKGLSHCLIQKLQGICLLGMLSLHYPVCCGFRIEWGLLCVWFPPLLFLCLFLTAKPTNSAKVIAIFMGRVIASAWAPAVL